MSDEKGAMKTLTDSIRSVAEGVDFMPFGDGMAAFMKGAAAALDVVNELAHGNIREAAVEGLAGYVDAKITGQTHAILEPLSYAFTGNSIAHNMAGAVRDFLSDEGKSHGIESHGNIDPVELLSSKATQGMKSVGITGPG